MSDSVAAVIADISERTATSLVQKNYHTGKTSVILIDASASAAVLGENNVKHLTGF
ncbi:MAG: hypothetical protein NTV34_13570 [Proteobacteria bacterium]|nr:hypothetical protein [Pseudomonadota bacterium]